MSTLPYSVTFSNIHDALTVTEWCVNNISDKDWSISMTALIPPQYKFSFAEEQTKLIAVLMIK